MLFPAATAAYDYTLRMLADGFVRMQPEEQIPLMTLVLEGFPLSDTLIEFSKTSEYKFECFDLFSAFTPECLSTTDLCAAYSRLSEAVRDPERGDRALKLLKRLGIDKAAASLPPQQFAPLIPLAFRKPGQPAFIRFTTTYSMLRTRHHIRFPCFSFKFRGWLRYRFGWL
ncbi:hypothetical protein KIN20_026791 [Parelaphostrongylus tenuis]|uniref:Epg5-like central TPR repeats domain-containing protein n=1 Tax=Parelaphostrongylus tenuis TaxID=148309 RepID=A0AAD5QYF7_PARTN|nr:hypothetical protein KIN20_026791 [Parelaphostrongylus tenuis]